MGVIGDSGANSDWFEGAVWMQLPKHRDIKTRRSFWAGTDSPALLAGQARSILLSGSATSQGVAGILRIGLFAQSIFLQQCPYFFRFPVRLVAERALPAV